LSLASIAPAEDGPAGALEGAGELVLFPVEDEYLASRCAARLLITAPASRGAEGLARRIHRSSARGLLPFLRTEARDLPPEPSTLRHTCGTLLDDAAGGTIFMNDVEAMPPVVQGTLLEVLEELESSRVASPAIRLVSGTAVALFDRVRAGAFSEALFYRLNVMHLVSSPSWIPVTLPPAPSRPVPNR
jgi:DNA-binding NtrC family response regulator